ncbi:EamA family transporter [Candidatus Formimonas warabiya]|uniref:EamA domain-containing protein n=1 Tax=Formimonas warabiya TaxID=1761012 RepID=A0A3G1KRZ0_FORW1|nr:EamA family transporter [Candidatus Formimonas warabiya]ATW25210.1 hypothetical protein DCMF_10920 [Candidatus Formimonas warabiya]
MEKINLASERLPILAYLTVCVIWGSTYLAIRIAVFDLPPFLSAGVRFVIAGLIMLAYARLKGLPFTNRVQIGRQSVVGLFLLLGGNGLVMLGSQWISSSVAALLFATVPLFMAAFGLILPGGEKLNWSGWLGLCIGFVGVALLVFTSLENLKLPLKGLIIILAGAFFWASGSVYSNRIGSTGSVEINLSIQMLAGGAGLLLTGFLFGEAGHLSLTSQGVLAILYLIFFGSLLGYSAYIYLLNVWPAARVGTYAYINPAVAMFLGSLILHEPITAFVVLGTFVILAGVFLVQYSARKRNTAPVSQIPSQTSH